MHKFFINAPTISEAEYFDLLSEFIGIMLGDGNIYVNLEKWQYQIDVSLNSIDEPRYLIYVKDLMEEIFGMEIKKVQTKGKGVSLRIYSKKVIQFLIDLGLKSGKKTLNQVGVPKYIFKKKNYIIKCLKGLFDTDGNISIDTKNDLRIRFSNTSKNLVEDFRMLCSKINIQSSPTITEDKNRKSWCVMVAKKQEIKRFIDLVNPEKLQEPIRQIWLASKLIYLNSSKEDQFVIKSKIINEIKKKGNKIFVFSKENSEFLKETCEKHLNIQITTDLIKLTIEDVIKLKKSMYNKSKAEMWKSLYEHLRSYTRITDYLIEIQSIRIPHRQTIREHIIQYMKEEKIDYEKWLIEFPFIHFGLDANGKFNKFPIEIRNKICELITLIINKNEDKKQEFDVLKILMKEFIKSDDILMIWLLKNPLYSEPTKQHIKSLIFLIQELVRSSKMNEKINMTSLSCDPRISINRRLIKQIIDNLKGKGLF